MGSVNKEMARAVLRHATVGPGCWLWNGATNPRGYGNMRFHKRYTRPHRLMMIAFLGEVPSNVFACHGCDTPRCVRPSHLFPGTAIDNSADAVSKGRTSHGEEHSAVLRKWWAIAPAEARARAIEFGARAAKLTPEDAKEVLARLAAGDRQQAIADDFGVSNQTISAINRGAPRRYLGGNNGIGQ